MFILGYNALSEGVIGNTIPSKSTYTKVSYYGDAVLDQLHMKSIEMEDADITAKFADIVADEWDNNSIYLGNFEDTLEAGSILTGLVLPLDKYIIRRKLAGELYDFLTSELDYFSTERYNSLTYNVDGSVTLNPTLVTIGDPNITNYKDYTARNNTAYTYTVYPAYTDGTEGQGVEGDGELSFSGWILSDTAATPTTAYVFDIMTKTNPFKTTRGFKMNENHTKFPTFRFNSKNFRSGGISTMPLDENLEVSESLRVELLDFLNDGEEKILRSPSSDAMLVMTLNPSYKYYDEIEDQVYSLDFEVVEIGEVT